MSVTFERSMVFIKYSGFLHQENWPSRYNWNILQSYIPHNDQSSRISINHEKILKKHTCKEPASDESCIISRLIHWRLLRITSNIHIKLIYEKEYYKISANHHMLLINFFFWSTPHTIYRFDDGSFKKLFLPNLVSFDLIEKQWNCEKFTDDDGHKVMVLN